MNILPQITQITQRNAAKLHYIAEKDRVVVSGVIIVLGFVCVNQRNLREILGVLCADRLSTLM